MAKKKGPSLAIGRGEKLPVSKGAGLTAKGTENLAGGRGDIASGAEKIASATKDAAARLGDNVANVPGAFETGAKAAQEKQQQETTAAKAAMDEIAARAKASAEVTAAELRKQFATPAKGEQNIQTPPPAAAQPGTGIFSSMAKIGGDVGGRAVDVSREQLVAQQRTAENTSKMIDKLDRLAPAQSTQTAAIYS